MANRGSSPRKSLSGGRSSSQGRFRISGASEAIVKKRVLPEGRAALIFSQEEGRKKAKSRAPRAASRRRPIPGGRTAQRGSCSGGRSAAASESCEERLWLVRRRWPSRRCGRYRCGWAALLIPLWIW